MRFVLVLALLGVGGWAVADPVRDLQRSLPNGWRAIRSSGELVIRRDAPVRIAGKYYPGSQHMSNAPVLAPPVAPKTVLEMRYRLEPAWTAAKLDATRAANAKVYAELVALRARFRLDDIPTGKGTPLPRNVDEQQRITAHDAAYQITLARLIQLPRCTLGGTALFDSSATYQQLDLMVDPPIAMREAYAIVELVKRRCR
ncbi:MAG: hypothetical protein H0V17_28260 [Deltaproteobacteria bacterium]|nr:hypothetical protein [Deltaproteobacteria bacterium]